MIYLSLEVGTQSFNGIFEMKRFEFKFALSFVSKMVIQLIVQFSFIREMQIRSSFFLLHHANFKVLAIIVIEGIPASRDLYD